MHALHGVGLHLAQQRIVNDERPAGPQDALPLLGEHPYSRQ
jgi:hypothetical protein